MRNITINWVGESKVINTTWGLKQKFSVKAKEEGDKFMDVWLKPDAPIWKVGEVREIESVEPREYNGKTYYSIKLPRPNPIPEILKRMETIENQYSKLAIRITNLENQLNPTKEIDYPKMKEEPDFDPKEPPF